MQHVECYVAYSIHGSNTYATANKQIEVERKPQGKQHLTIDGMEFTVTSPRDGSTPQRGASKLLTDELMETSTHSSQKHPTTNANKVNDFFLKLRSLGWNVDLDAFQRKHKIAATIEKTPEPVVTGAPPTPPVDTQPTTQVTATDKVEADADNFRKEVDLPPADPAETANDSAPSSTPIPPQVSTPKPSTNKTNASKSVLGPRQTHILELLRSGKYLMPVDIKVIIYNVFVNMDKETLKAARETLKTLVTRGLIEVDGPPIKNVTSVTAAN